eukprot:scaffold1190_cov393-Prasinococcus_capsulatus_cf.AAC.33
MWAERRPGPHTRRRARPLRAFLSPAAACQLFPDQPRAAAREARTRMSSLFWNTHPGILSCSVRRWQAQPTNPGATTCLGTRAQGSRRSLRTSCEAIASGETSSEGWRGGGDGGAGRDTCTDTKLTYMCPALHSVSSYSVLELGKVP